MPTRRVPAVLPTTVLAFLLAGAPVRGTNFPVDPLNEAELNAEIANSNGDGGAGVLTFNTVTGGTVALTADLTALTQNIQLNVDTTDNAAVVITDDGTARTGFSGAFSLTKTGSDTLTFSDTGGGLTNTFSGGLTISSGTVSAGSDNHLGTGSITLDGGTLQAIGLTTAKDVAVTTAGGAIDTGGQNSTFTGKFTGNTGTIYRKTGAGVLSLNNTGNTLGPRIQVDAGTLALTNGSSVGRFGVLLNGGTAQARASFTDAHTLDMMSAGMFDTQAFTVTHTGGTTGTGALTKIGAGTFVAGGTAAHTGATLVSAGTFDLTGDWRTSPFTVTARLMGTGTSGALAAGNGSRIAPGGSIGTLSTVGDVVFMNGSTLEVEVDSGGNEDLSARTRPPTA